MQVEHLTSFVHCEIQDWISIVDDWALILRWCNLQDWEEGDGDFVAPELLSRGAHAEASADIYSFGATMYELITGMISRGPDGMTYDLP